MALDPHRLSPSQLMQLMNATPLEATVNRERVYRQRDLGDFRIGDGQTIDLIRYAAWLLLEWLERQPPATTEGGTSHGAEPARA